MVAQQTRRRFLTGTVAAGAITLAGCVDDEEPADDADEPADDVEDDDDVEDVEQTYEIWAADQGLDNIHVYEGVEDSDEFEEIDQIDLSDNGGRPHMIHYTSDYEYAVATNVEGPVVIDTESKEIVAEAETGGGSHFTGFGPDDESIVVDVIGDNGIVKLDWDAEEEELSNERELVPSEEVEEIEDSQNPVCHSWDHNGRSIHTLGPSYHDGGVVIVDHDEFEIVESWHGEEMQANCGTMPHPTENKFYLTAGLPSGEDEDGEGYVYVLDTETDEVSTTIDAEGIDTHGFWYTTDGEELWALNRESNDGIVIDPDTDEQIDTIEAYSPVDENPENERSDILWSSPDGNYMFATLRGPNPQSATHVAEGETPGFSVLDTETREVVDVIEPVDDEDADFHGIGVRPVGEFDVDVGMPPF